jgi:hypothetical protein
MKIHNVRMGFATNSSSTHSIIFMPNKFGIVDELADEDFGWQYFFSCRSYKFKS